MIFVSSNSWSIIRNIPIGRACITQPGTTGSCDNTRMSSGSWSRQYVCGMKP